MIDKLRWCALHLILALPLLSGCSPLRYDLECEVVPLRADFAEGKSPSDLGISAKNAESDLERAGMSSVQLECRLRTYLGGVKVDDNVASAQSVR